jgi:hypothetical protein
MCALVCRSWHAATSESSTSVAIAQCGMMRAHSRNRLKRSEVISRAHGGARGLSWVLWARRNSVLSRGIGARVYRYRLKITIPMWLFYSQLDILPSERVNTMCGYQELVPRSLAPPPFESPASRSSCSAYPRFFALMSQNHRSHEI